MDEVTKTPLKQLTARRFLRSYFGRIIVVLILIVVISSWIWWQAFAEYRKEDRIAEKIRNEGGSVYYQGILHIGPLHDLYCFHVYFRVVSVDLCNCKKPNVLPGDINELRHLQELDLTNSLITDADLEHLRGLSQLEDLRLRGTQISDSGLENLRGLGKLRYLDISYTHISDAGLEHLNGMNISGLNLGETAVTENVLGAVSEAGLEHLKGMTNLKRLIFYITPSNRVELQNALPNCTICTIHE